MEIKSFATVDVQIVKELEENLGINLPEDYRNFLVTNNGAKIIDGYFFVKDLDQKILMDVFFGINLGKRDLNLTYWHQEFKDEIPNSSLLIGDDPGGGFILLINNGIDDGIYYYDHSYFFDASNDESNTFLIVKSFTDFLKMLANY